MRPALPELALVALFAAAAPAQVCQSGETFFKNDNLPQVPGGATPMAVIPGLCEGEAMGCVIDVSSLGSSAVVRSASVAYVNASNQSGIQATVNLEIYDGITWSGNPSLPSFGPKVFDLAAASGSNVALISSGLNQVDLSAYGATVTSGTAVIVWEMIDNPGNCASGYQTNFATDHAGGPGGCAPAQKNLIFIAGQGWRDVTTAKVSGFPLCPLFVAGNWVARICADAGAPVGPVDYCTAGTSASGCQATLGSSGSASATAPSGFTIAAVGVEGQKDGLFFFAQNGRQANPWGNGTSFQCVVPPVFRGGLLAGNGTPGACDGTFGQDLNARWCPTCPKPAQAPTPGVRLQLQLWYRDPASTSNQSTSLSNAREVDVLP